jgi:hypothetical protein
MTATRVLDIARSQIGVEESPHGSNRQPYGRAYGWDGVAWCAQFVWWVMTQAGNGPLVPKTASTVVMRNWYRARHQWVSDPRPGDIAFFKFPGNNNPVNHVAFVEGVERGGSIITIEGNTAGTSAGDQRNGGMVARKRRLSNIVGFARPNYGIMVPKTEAPQAPKLPVPREDEFMLIKSQPDKSKPEVIAAAILTGFNFVGLGRSEMPSDEQAKNAGIPVMWVEWSTFQEFDRRSHIMLGDIQPQPQQQPAAK